MNKKNIFEWYGKHFRPLPWRKTSDPYKIWVSEVFLQQTQASRVIEFYTRMIERFPTIDSLAESDWDHFFPYFKGLGFYSRGKNMLKCSKEVVEKYDGVFPNDIEKLEKLPGIGEYTAHALVSFAYKENVPALDVNLYRVFGRVWNLENKKNEIKKKAFEFYRGEKNIIKNEKYLEYSGDILNHFFMDIGSRFCTAKKVECENCPLKKECSFFLEKKVIVKEKKIMKKRYKADEFSVLVLRKKDKYLLTQKKNEKGQKKWGFFIFARDVKKEKDHRHFLQKISQKKWGIEISVRPPFYIEEISKNSFHSSLARLRFSRSQIISEEFPEQENMKFFSWKEIECLDLEEIYSDEFLEKLKKMRV